MLEVTAAKYLDGHRVRICFSNGAEGTVDLADALWGPMFEPLKDPAVFRCFEVSPALHTLCWKNDADFAPEFLYAKMVEQEMATSSLAEDVDSEAARRRAEMRDPNVGLSHDEVWQRIRSRHE